MNRILLGLVAAIAVATGAFFGFQLYTQHRVEGEIDAAFDNIRSTGSKASHGSVSYGLISRTLTISDIAVESAAQPPVSLKVAKVTASGVGQPDPARFAAESLEATGIEISAGMAAMADTRIGYTVPRITVKDYSGPASPPRQGTSAPVIDPYLFAIEQLSGVAASSITAPDIAATVTFGAAAPGGGEIAYSGLTMRGIKDGKIAEMKLEKATFKVNLQQAGKAETFTGELENVVSSDLDIAAVAAVRNPQQAGDDRYYRMYRQISTGPYSLTFERGVRMRMDGMTIDDVGVWPSRLQLPALLAMMPQAGAAPTPAQAREMIERAARLYGGFRIGNAEMRGLSMQTPQGPIQLSAMRFNLDKGKFGEFAFEGLNSVTPTGPFRVGRFALKSLDLAGMLRMAAQFSNPAQPPAPDAALGFLPLIEGAELKGLVAPYKNTGKPVSIDAFSVDWGQFVGPIPSRAHLAAKMSAPVDRTNPAQMPLVAAGLDTVAIDVDLGATWTEGSSSFALAPAKLELAGLLSASAGLSLANVPRGMFSLNPQQAAALAAEVETGTLELTLRDLGVVDLLVAQFARAQKVNRDTARTTIIDNIRTNGEKAVAANPDAAAAVEALTRFFGSPGQTLLIKLTPLGKVPALQLIQLLKTDPNSTLAQFRIEASTGL